MTRPDVVVVGSGPNGLAAAVTLARAGLGVLVLESQPTVGGGARTLDLGLADGITHDICSAVHPMAWASPFFQQLDLPARGVELLVPEVSYAHPLPGGRAGVAYRDLERTVEGLGVDGAVWRSLLGGDPAAVVRLGLFDKRSVPLVDPRAALRFGLGLLEQGTRAWDRRFVGDVAPALLTGVAAHAISPLPSLAAAGAALMLGTLAHAEGGWPIPRGGSGAITGALVADLEAHGGTIRTDHRVRSQADLPVAHCYVFDTTPRTLVQVLGHRLPPRARDALDAFEYGDAAAKVDFVLDGPVPWTVPEVGRAGTVHVGGTRAEMARAENAVARGRARGPADDAGQRPDRRRRLPRGARPTAPVDLRPRAVRVRRGRDRGRSPGTSSATRPGFRDVVVTSRCVPASRLSDHNENYVDGDISAGRASIGQLFARPTRRLDPYFSGRAGVYLCSASTPPGPGVHGLGGWYAARRVLREFGIMAPPSLAP